MRTPVPTYTPRPTTQLRPTLAYSRTWARCQTEVPSPTSALAATSAVGCVLTVTVKLPSVGHDRRAVRRPGPATIPEHHARRSARSLPGFGVPGHPAAASLAGDRAEGLHEPAEQCDQFPP